MEVSKKSSGYGIGSNGECFFVALEPNGIKSTYVARNFYRMSSATAQNVHSQLRTRVIVNNPLQIQNLILRASTASLTGRTVSELGADYSGYCDLETSVIPESVSLDEFLKDYLEQAKAELYESQAQAGSSRGASLNIQGRPKLTSQSGQITSSKVIHRKIKQRMQLSMVLDREAKSIGGQLAHISDVLRFIYTTYRLQGYAEYGFQDAKYCEYYDNDKWESNYYLILYKLIKVVGSRNITHDLELKVNAFVVIFNCYLFNKKCVAELEENWRVVYPKATAEWAGNVANLELWSLCVYHFLMEYAKEYESAEILDTLKGKRSNFPCRKVDSPDIVTLDGRAYEDTFVKELQRSERLTFTHARNFDFFAAYLRDNNDLFTIKQIDQRVGLVFLTAHCDAAKTILLAGKTWMFLRLESSDEDEDKREAAFYRDPLRMGKAICEHEAKCESPEECRLCCLKSCRTVDFPYCVSDIRKMDLAPFFDQYGEYLFPNFKKYIRSKKW